MLGKLLLPVIRFKYLPPLFCLSFGAFLSLVLTAFVLEARSSQKHSELMANYGNTLAGLVAKDTADPVMARDLLSLHAIILDVVTLPRVRFAVVYDVDRELVAQAGKLPSRVDVRQFTAPVLLHGQAVGHVAITLVDDFLGDRALLWTLLATSALLLLMSGLSLFESRAEVFVWRKPVMLPSEHEKSVASPEIDSNDIHPDVGSVATRDVVEAQNWQYADLILSLPNYTALEQQLSDIVFSRRVALFEREVKNILTLYDGCQVETPGAKGIYCLRFRDCSSVSEAIFAAISSACLVQSLDQQQKIKFHFLAEVCAQDDDVKLIQSASGVFMQSGLLDDFLRERVLVDALEGERLLVTGLQSSYAVILDEQLEAMQAIL